MSWKRRLGPIAVLLAAAALGSCNQSQTTQTKATPVDPKIAAFQAGCSALQPMVPTLPQMCADMAARKSPIELQPFIDALEGVNSNLKKAGPDLAKQIVSDCAKMANSAKPDLSSLIVCVDFRTLHVQDIAKGNGSVNQISTLLQKASEQPEQVPADKSASSENQRKAIRQS